MSRVSTRTYLAAFILIAFVVGMVFYPTKSNSSYDTVNGEAGTDYSPRTESRTPSPSNRSDDENPVRSSPIRLSTKSTRFRVVTESGELIKDAFCLVNPAPQRSVDRRSLQQGNPDANGIIALALDPSIDIKRLGFYAAGFIPRFLSADEFSGDPMEIALSRGRSKSFKVEDVQGIPVLGVDIVASQRPISKEDASDSLSDLPGVSSSWRISQATTDATGSATIHDFPESRAVVSIRSRVVAPVNLTINHFIQEPSAETILIRVGYIGVAAGVLVADDDVVVSQNISRTAADRLIGKDVQPFSSPTLGQLSADLRAAKCDLFDLALFPSPMTGAGANRVASIDVMRADESVHKATLRYRTADDSRVAERILVPGISSSRRTSGVRLRIVDGADREMEGAITLMRSPAKPVPGKPSIRMAPSYATEVMTLQDPPPRMLPGTYLVSLPAGIDGIALSAPKSLVLEDGKIHDVVIRMPHRVRKVSFTADSVEGPRHCSGVNIHSVDTGEMLESKALTPRFIRVGRWVATPYWREFEFAPVNFEVVDGVGLQSVPLRVDHGSIDYR